MINTSRCKKSVKAYALFTALCIFVSCSMSGCKKVSEEQSGLTSGEITYTSTENLTNNETDNTSVLVESQAETLNKLTSNEPITETSLNSTETQPESLFETVKSTESAKPVESISTAKTEEPQIVTAVYETTSRTTDTAAKIVEMAEIQTQTTVAMKPAKTTAAAESTLILAETMNVFTNTYKTLNFKEQKGFWFSYLEFQRLLKNKTQAQFKKSIGECFDNVSELGFNTVYVHARAFGDAYYNSDLFPATDCFNGTVDTSKKFDALQIMIDEAHSRGLSIHAWINPMRLMTDTQINSISNKYLIKKWYSSKYKGTYMVKSGDRWYLNPAYSEVTDLIANGAAEIAKKYNIDGIQIDDYFYPTTAASFDSKAYSLTGNEKTLSQWRINNVNAMVKKIYKAVHNANPNVIFGISPQGFVENNYTELYADVKTWVSVSGYCDYILPQIYFGFNNAAFPYDKAILEWQSMCTSKDVQLVIGLAAYKIGTVDTYAGTSGKNEWINNSDILSRQLALAKTLDKYGGVAIFRYDSLFYPSSAVSNQISTELDNIRKN